MAREAKEQKKLELIPVDEEAESAMVVPRLDNVETAANALDPDPLILGPQISRLEPSRLELPDPDEVELRTHQPNVESLLDTEGVSPDLAEEAWGGELKQSQPVPWGWFVLIGMAVTGAVVWSLMHVRKADDQVVRIREETESVLAREKREEKESRELINRIDEALRYYFNATRVEALVECVRHPERVVPLMREFHKSRPVSLSPFRKVRVLQPITIDHRTNFWIASVELANGQQKNVVIEIDETGNPLIDWETLVCHQPMPWDEFALQRPVGTSLDFRVYARRDTFFSHEFADSGRWLCFRLSALEGEQALFGYVAADSPEARKMLSLTEANGGGKTSMILRLSVPEGLKSPRGVVIEKVINSRWMYLDPPNPVP